MHTRSGHTPQNQVQVQIRPEMAESPDYLFSYDYVYAQDSFLQVSYLPYYPTL